MAPSEKSRRLERRRLRCPLCAAEIERNRCLCDCCGAVVHATPRGDALRLDGVVCFACGSGNPGADHRRECFHCGRPFAVTCPVCTAPVPLESRYCGSCGTSVEEFDAERARREVEQRQERRASERVLFAVFRWQIVVGTALMALGLVVGRSDGELRRQLVGAGAGTGAFGALPLGLARVIGPRFRRGEA